MDPRSHAAFERGWSQQRVDGVTRRRYGRAVAAGNASLTIAQKPRQAKTRSATPTPAPRRNAQLAACQPMGQGELMAGTRPA